MTIDFDVMADRCFERGRESALGLAEAWEMRANAAEAENARLKAERLKLDKRIHNQRVALRQTWEIVEMRRNYMGSPASRAAYARLLKRYAELKAEQLHAAIKWE